MESLVISPLVTPATPTTGRPRVASQLSPGESPPRKSGNNSNEVDLAAFPPLCPSEETRAGGEEGPPSTPIDIDHLLLDITSRSERYNTGKKDATQTKWVLSFFFTTILTLTNEIKDSRTKIDELSTQVKQLTEEKDEQKRRVKLHEEQVNKVKKDMEKKKGEEIFRRDLVNSDRMSKIHAFPVSKISFKPNSNDFCAESTMKNLIDGDDLKRNALHNAKLTPLVKKNTNLKSLNPTEKVPLLITSTNSEKRWEFFNTFRNEHAISSHFAGTTYKFIKKIRDEITNGNFRMKPNCQIKLPNGTAQVLIRSNRALNAINISTRNSKEEAWAFLSSASCTINGENYKNVFFSNIELTK